MNLQEIAGKMDSLKDWSLEGNTIVKIFSFRDFKESIKFVNDVAVASDKINHHPDILINYNSVRLLLTTHSQKSLTEKDFELAKEIDKIC